jgi:signal transduction histidine kinase
MLAEQPAVGFAPAPGIELHSGNLYNVVINLLVFLCCLYAGWVIFNRGEKKAFSFFLVSIGFYWFVIAAGNLYAWFNAPYPAGYVFLVKSLIVFPPILLAYFLCTELFERKSLIALASFIYMLIAAAFLYMTITIDQTQSTVTYWGVQWQVSGVAFDIFRFGLLLPLGMGASFLLLESLFDMIINRKSVNVSLYIAAFLFVFLENVQIGAATISWPRLLSRFLYILIAFLGYIYFSERVKEDKFIPQDGNAAPRRMRRIPFFVKLLIIFVLLSVIPITISSLLMFVSFKEVIDIYVYKPMLWNLEVSREAFLTALSYVQVQALFLMILTGALVFVAAAIVSREISRSLRAISSGMERVSSGDYSFKLRPDSNDEIGDVINYFNNMSAEIKRSREIIESWNRELEVKVVERTEDLRALYNVSKAIGSSLDVRLLFNRAISHLLPIIKADVYLLILPDEKRRFFVRFSQGVDLENVRVEEREGILGRVLQKNEILFSEKVASDPRCQGDFCKKLGVKTLIVAPLRTKGRIRGILCLGTKGDRKYSKEREVRLLATISDQLAVALENVGIFEKEKEAVERLTALDGLKNQFISMVSHELRTPVTSIDGYVSLFLAGAVGPLSDDQKKYLTLVKQNDQRLLAIINRLLDFYQIESGRFSIKKELISINEVVQSVIDTLRPQIEKSQAKIRQNLQAKNEKFMGDKDKLIEVLSNLVENAIKFAKQGEVPSVEVSTHDAGDFIRVEVADEGVGIEDGHLVRIFNKFYQIENYMIRKAGGVGLGLSIVREIIAGHQGKIWAESEGLGKGARFVFTLPVAEKV